MRKRASLDRCWGRRPAAIRVCSTVDPGSATTVERRLNDMPQVHASAAARRHPALPGAERHVHAHHLGGARPPSPRPSPSAWSTTTHGSHCRSGAATSPASGCSASPGARSRASCSPSWPCRCWWRSPWGCCSAAGSPPGWSSISHPERFRLPGDVSSQRLAFAVLVTLARLRGQWPPRPAQARPPGPDGGPQDPRMTMPRTVDDSTNPLPVALPGAVPAPSPTSAAASPLSMRSRACRPDGRAPAAGSSERCGWRWRWGWR